MDCSPSSSSVHGILQARVLEWVTVPSSRGIFSTQGWNGFSCVSCIGKRVFYHQCHLGACIVLSVCQNPYSEASTAFRIMSKFLNLTRSETPHQQSHLSLFPASPVLCSSVRRSYNSPKRMHFLASESEEVLLMLEISFCSSILLLLHTAQRSH